jgi:hypothetical protein
LPPLGKQVLGDLGLVLVGLVHDLAGGHGRCGRDPQLAVPDRAEGRGLRQAGRLVLDLLVLLRDAILERGSLAVGAAASTTPATATTPAAPATGFSLALARRPGQARGGFLGFILGTTLAHDTLPVRGGAR